MSCYSCDKTAVQRSTFDNKLHTDFCDYYGKPAKVDVCKSGEVRHKWKIG